MIIDCINDCIECNLGKMIVILNILIFVIKLFNDVDDVENKLRTCCEIIY